MTAEERKELLDNTEVTFNIISHLEHQNAKIISGTGQVKRIFTTNKDYILVYFNIFMIIPRETDIENIGLYDHEYQLNWSSATKTVISQNDLEATKMLDNTIITLFIKELKEGYRYTKVNYFVL